MKLHEIPYVFNCFDRSDLINCQRLVELYEDGHDGIPHRDSI